MSADNWRKCPNCKKEHEEKLKEIEQKLLEAYKTVTAEEYLEMVHKSDEFKKAKYGDMAEYYWFHMNDNLILEIHYSCVCETCGFEFVYNESVNTNERV